jgi:uncharacterized protein with HEPN domain
MSKREPFLLIQDMLESIQKIKSYTLGMTWQDFQNDDKTIDAVIRNFEIIGEAANRVPDDIKDRNEQINWHKIRGFRNRIVHDYMGVDLQIIWHIIENSLKELQEQLEDVLNNR